MADGRVGGKSLSVAIYMEGGGPRNNTKAALRQGMQVFLGDIKDACRRRGRQWKLVCCGSRNEAYQGFQNALQNADAGIVILLVDSESNVGSATPTQHLATLDGWKLDDVSNDLVHLMVQTMETWIVADPAALRAYYQRGFREKALPQHPNLEKVNKTDISQALGRATQGSDKGKYQKIRHAQQILRHVNSRTVRERCSSCERLFETLLSLIRHTA